jgi:hypothetical protein
MSDINIYNFNNGCFFSQSEKRPQETQKKKTLQLFKVVAGAAVETIEKEVVIHCDSFECDNGHRYKNFKNPSLLI